MRVTQGLAATVGLVLALGLAACGTDQEADETTTSRVPTSVVGQVTAGGKTCQVGDAACRAPRAVRWSVPVDVPVAVTATEEHSRIDLLVPYDGTTPQDGDAWLDRLDDYLLVGAADVVYLRAAGQVVVVSADTGVVEYTGDADGYAAPEAQASPDPSPSRVDTRRLSLAVDDLLRAEGWPVVDGVPLMVALGCADASIDPTRPISGGAPAYVGYCVTPVLFAVNS